MGKDSADKKHKKEKKEKRASEVDGVKKSKKEKKSKANGDVDVTMTDALEAELVKEPETSSVKVVNGADVKGAIVPFAEPMVDGEKEVKKVLRGVKKSAKHKTLRRGVKEVVKYLRKSSPSDSSIANPSAIVIIAADISPMDVISHIPVLCEDHNIPYVFVRSRVELGEASATKRPTSVTLVAKERNKKGKDMNAEEKAEWEETWESLRAVVTKAGKTVKK
ncbi:L30e-like protein [Massarina eburnea CBS 473.64]|uniref:L30e-like protein n=1 Tax=Massarina eburnea CBS 473.64 TaxID=1395130 RepID=A0A6A6RLT9_9PLEO|nr:L30e-like protein [Massarina eburnea CBS 473.64]